MLKRLRSIVFSVPSMTVAALFVLYLLLGYFALPATLKWQAEKQVRERLGHSLSLGMVHFDPLVFKFEIQDLRLSDAKDQPMLGLRRLFVDFEAWRSMVDGAWTFSTASVEAPRLDFTLDENGRHNFSALIDRLAGPRSDPGEAFALPRLAVQRIAVSDGHVEFSDRLLAEPMVTRIAPLSLEVDALSTVAATPGHYRLRAPSAAGEVFETSGEMALNPVAAKGQWAISGLKVETLARALSRIVAIDAPAGRIEMAASFDVGVDGSGQVAGTVQALELGVAALSLSAAGGKAPLLAIEQMALKEGRIDIGKREVSFADFKLAKGRVAASIDPQGRFDWATLVRSRAEPAEAAAPPTVAEARPESSTPLPWRVSIINTDVSDIAVSLIDASQGLNMQIDAIALKGSPSAEVGSAGVKMRFDKPALSLARLRAEQGDGRVAAPELALETGQVSLATGAGSLDIALGAARVTAAQGLSLKQLQLSFDAAGGSLQTGPAAIQQAGANTRGTIESTRLALSGVSTTHAGQSATLQDLSIDGEGVTLQSAPAKLAIGLKTLRTALAEMQAKRGEENLALRMASLAADEVALSQDDSGLRIEMTSPSLSGDGARAERGVEHAALDSLSIKGSSASLTSAGDGALGLALQTFAVAAGGAAINRGDDGLDLRQADLGAQSVSLTMAGGRLQLDSRAAKASLAGLAARQGSERIALDDGAFEAGALSASAGDEPPVSAGRAAATFDPPSAASTATTREGGGFQARFDDAAMRLGSLKVIALGAASDLGQLASATLTAKSFRLAESGGVLDLVGDGLGAELSNAALHSPRDATEVLRLGRATVAGAAFRLRERRFSADSLTLGQADVKTWLDDQGQLNLLGLFGTAPAPVEGAPMPSDTSAPWRIAVKQAQVDELAIGFEDRRESPPFALRLEPIRVRVAALDTAAPAPMQLELQATLASGGEIRVDGSVHPTNGAADLNLNLADIAIAPVQSYLSKFAELQLASGTASSKGRLLYGDAASGARLSYQGSMTVDRLLLEELAPKRPFLAWESIRSEDVLLTLEPNRADIGELLVDKPSSRLIIAADQSVNLGDVLKKTDAGEARTGAAASQPAETAETFPISIARLRVTDGVLEFADLSLRPQFATRMHELKGVITGLGSDPNHSAKVQLDARVDRYGSAKIRGQISVLEPERQTEVEMAFRNLEMTSLSPYVAKFAGYKVAAGRLALDLQYKVKDRKLLGKNKIVLSQVALGDKVESPDALDLPLELALGILKDSKGVIDIGLPVSGDLGDPKFDYGAVIGKAIGNLLGSIVTAPFKALGALFGGGDKTLDTIAFEPGDDALAPPERQKLATLARALTERPGLSLVVPPTIAASVDTPVLKSLAVRTEIVRRMGIEVAAGEDPGPIDVANARTQRAIDAVFSTRYAPAVLDVLKQRAVETRVAAAGAATVPGVSAAASAPAPPAIQPPPAFYQGLVDRLISEQPITDDQLATLGTRRGEAVLRELSDVGGVPAARLALGKTTAAIDADDKAVTLQLELKAAP